MENNNIRFSPKVASAFVKFQGMVKPIKKTKEVNTGGYTYAYAEFSDVCEAIQADMKACDLAFYQKVTTSDDKVTVVTYIIHSSGEYFDGGEFSLKIKDHHPQKMGALLSFARRYSLVNCLGLSVCSDLDCIDVPPTKEEKPVQKDENKSVVQNEKTLASWKLLAVENKKIDRVSEMRRFHGICKKQFGITDESDLRCLVWRFSNGKASSRAALDGKQYKLLNDILETCTTDEVKKIIEATKKKMAQTA